jgi:tRNA(Arg) A34 adenosine deaminase TadA
MDATLARAVKLAGTARHRSHKHSAMVFRGGALISQGVNHDTQHAEVQALKKLWPSHREGTTVLTIRMTKGGVLGMAKPCPICEAYMRGAGVKKVIYSDKNGQMVTMRL